MMLDVSGMRKVRPDPVHLVIATSLTAAARTSSPTLAPLCADGRARQISISPDNSTVTVGPGVQSVVLQAALYDSGIQGAAVPTAYCSFVGVGGGSSLRWL
jgi:FAD/FMN-containing dehydrogenase